MTDDGPLAGLSIAAQDVRDVVGLYDQFLPKGSQKPFVMKFNFSQMPIIARPAQQLADLMLSQAYELDQQRPVDDISVMVVRVSEKQGDNVRRATIRLPLE